MDTQTNDNINDGMYDDVWGLDDSDQNCPRCKIYSLKIYPEGTSKDDYTNALICPNCHYFERD